MNDIYTRNGSTLIATWDSIVIKHCNKIIYKINIEELNEDRSMKLFITPSCGQKHLFNEHIKVEK